MNDSLTILKASAGSGKTFALSREYIRLVVENPAVFRHILAITFTNKATEEMKSRILQDLYRLASGNNSPHLEFLISATGKNEKQVRAGAEKALNLILHEYSHYSVTTIDSFFQKVFRAFLYELDIKFNFDIILDNQAVLEEAVQKMIDSLRDGSPLTGWLSGFIQSRMEDGKSHSLKGDLLKTGKEIFREQFLPYREEMLNISKDKVLLESFRKELEKIRAAFIKEQNRRGSEMMDLILKAGFSVDDFYYKKTGPAGFVMRAAVSSDPVHPANRFMDASVSVEGWVGTKVKDPSPVRILAGNELVPLAAEYIEWYDREVPACLGAISALKYIYHLGILAELSRNVAEYTSENGYFLLSEVPRLLALFAGNSGTPFLFEKAGVRYQHFMLDEFQDTSALQYLNIKPLVENGLSQAYRSLVVGDVKQSIYRWRNSDWKLLVDLPNDFSAFNPESDSLTSNYRSRKNIIEFNNSFFSILPDLAVHVYKERSGEEAPVIPEIYAGHEQEQGRTDFPDDGFVRMSIFPEDDYEDSILTSWLPETASKWWNKGFRNIAVIARENKNVPKIFDALNNYSSGDSEPMRVVSGDSLALVSSPGVRLILAHFSYISNPLDEVAKTTLVRLYLENFAHGREFPFSPSPAGYSKRMTEILPSGWNDLLTQIRALPLFEIAEHIASFFGLWDNENEVPYLMNFLDAVRDISAKTGAGLAAFMEHWEEEGEQLNISMADEKDAVKIITIHKSKGLEFDVVLIPFPDWKMGFAQHENLMWAKSDEYPFSMVPAVLLNMDGNAEASNFSKVYYDELLRNYVDNLNLMYVACTRPVSVLEIACKERKPKKKDEDRSVLISDLIVKVVNSPGLSHSYDAENGVFSLGNPDIIIPAHHEPGNVKVIKSPGNGGMFNADLLVEDRSSDEDGVYSDQKIQFGILVHSLMSELTCPDNIEEKVSRFIARENTDAETAARLLETVQRIFAEPEVSSWFLDWDEVYTERTILKPGGRTRRPDRVVVKGKKALVIDYKTGQPDPAKHEVQVSGYMKLMKEMGYSHVEGRLLYLTIPAIVRVKDPGQQ